MNILSYGGGVNSTALIIGCLQKDIPIEAIIFSDTGGEKPHTYEYIETFSKWCVKNGLQEITIVSTRETLEDMCIRLNTLPSVAFGFKTCSQRYKKDPQVKWLNNYEPAKEFLKSGEKITKLIGCDFDEPQRAKHYEDKNYSQCIVDSILAFEEITKFGIYAKHQRELKDISKSMAKKIEDHEHKLTIWIEDERLREI